MPPFKFSSPILNPFTTRLKPRQILLSIGTAILLLSVIALLWFDVANTVQATSSLITVTLSNFAPSQSRCNSQCSVDPFTRLGMLVHGQNNSDTRWIPFPPQQGPSRLSSSDIQYDAGVSEEAESLACPQFMKMLENANETSEIDWVKDRTVLFIGSSHDRNNVEYFCEELGGSYSTIGSHVAGSCNITSHNLVLAFWFTFGAIDSESYDWFAKTEVRPITFERKIEEVMLPWMAQQGINNPDLIIETSLFWDDNFLYQRTTHLNETARATAPFTYSELAWHRSRLHTLVSHTRSLYGQNIPIMFRTRHFRQSNGRNRILRVFQLDQNLRAVAQELDVKLFPWGDILEGVTTFYDNDQHFPRGPVTWLFGDMILFYLKQAITPDCWYCYTGLR